MFQHMFQQCFSMFQPFPSFHTQISAEPVPEAWFVFADSELPVLEELAKLLGAMLQSCKRTRPPPRLRVALQVAAEKLENVEAAGHEFAAGVLTMVKAHNCLQLETFFLSFLCGFGNVTPRILIYNWFNLSRFWNNLD